MNKWICRDLAGTMEYYVLKEEAVYASKLHGDLYDRMWKASKYRDEADQKMVDYNCQRRLDILCQKLDIHLKPINDHNHESKRQEVLAIDLNHDLGIERTIQEERRLDEFFNKRYGSVVIMKKKYYWTPLFNKPHFFNFKNPNLSEKEEEQLIDYIVDLIQEYGINCEIIDI